MNAEIPDKVIAYNIYTNGVKLGVTGKVDTPEFKMKTSTMSGAGVGGEIEVPTLGQWEKTEHEIPLTLLGEDLAELLQQGMDVQLIYRGATQCALKSGGFATKQLRIVEGGIVKGFKGGSLEAGSQMEASVTLETVRYKMENAGEELIAIDASICKRWFHHGTVHRGRGRNGSSHFVPERSPPAEYRHLEDGR